MTLPYFKDFGVPEEILNFKKTQVSWKLLQDIIKDHP